MNYFEYRNKELFCENLRVQDLAEKYGTPLYIYSAATIRRHFQAFDSAFANIKHLTCYSVKASSNLSILQLLAKQGAGMDIVSGGELFRALQAGVPAQKIVYSGVGKTQQEIQEALIADILLFNVESVEELERIANLAQHMGKTARITFRINPNVDPQTHPYISTGMKKNKFGLDMSLARQAYAKALDLPCVTPIGIDCHIGSQLTSIAPFEEALDKLLEFITELQEMGVKLQYLDIGGGLGIRYDQETPPLPEEFGKMLQSKLQNFNICLILEPGRIIVGNTGILVTQVQYTKKTPTKNFIIVDAAMNDLLRPALYQSYHKITPITDSGRQLQDVDIVGPICESSDFLARDRAFPEVQQGEFLAVHSAGAYGFSMASNYNSRPRAAEIIVDGENSIIARQRETYEDLIALEKL